MTHTVRLTGEYSRAQARRLIEKAPAGFVMTIAEPKRTLEQSAKMWAMLSDISRAKPLDRRHTPEDWKAIIMNACGWECQFMTGLDGRPFPQGFRSSQLTKSQMATMIEYMMAFGAENGVHWSDERKAA
jgi:hypothetical protein